MSFFGIVAGRKPADEKNVLRKRQLEIEQALIRIHGPDKTAKLLVGVRGLANQIYDEMVGSTNRYLHPDQHLPHGPDGEASPSPHAGQLGSAIQLEVRKLVKAHLNGDDEHEHHGTHDH